VSFKVSYTEFSLADLEAVTNLFWCASLVSKYGGKPAHGKPFHELVATLRKAGVGIDNQMWYVLSWWATTDMIAIPRMLKSHNKADMFDECSQWKLKRPRWCHRGFCALPAGQCASLACTNARSSLATTRRCSSHAVPGKQFAS
jgi:hypothetical protein